MHTCKNEGNLFQRMTYVTDVLFVASSKQNGMLSHQIITDWKILSYSHAHHLAWLLICENFLMKSSLSKYIVMKTHFCGPSTLTNIKLLSYLSHKNKVRPLFWSVQAALALVSHHVTKRKRYETLRWQTWDIIHLIKLHD